MFWNMFIIFFKIGAFTIGGGYAMIPIIQEEIVNKNKWIKEEEFLDILAIAQSSPGPIALNTSIYVGHILGGVKGALICALGTVLPSFLIILLVATVFFQYRNNPSIERMFLGVRAAVVALIASAVYKLIKSFNFNYTKLFMVILALFAVIFLNISPIYLILMGGIGSMLYYRRKAKE